MNHQSVCPSHADPSVHSHCSLGASCFTLLLCPHDVAAFDGKDDGDKEDKRGRDGNDYHGQAVPSGNPSPMMAGHQPARKWPMQMSKVKASQGSCQRSCQNGAVDLVSLLARALVPPAETPRYTIFTPPGTGGPGYLLAC